MAKPAYKVNGKKVTTLSAQILIPKIVISSAKYTHSYDM